MIIVPALFGLLLCLFNASGAEIFCLTNGCAIYDGYTLFGLSLYIFGAAGFAVILVLALFSAKSGLARFLLYWTILLALLLDMVLLAWQLLYWPCSSCLVVALLLGASAAGYSFRFGRSRRWLLKGALLGWLILLLPSAVAVGKEVMLSPWMVYGSPQADIQVFFSPTCPACSTEIAKLLRSPELERMAFYPVAKNERDVLLVATLLQQGLTDPQDLRKLFSLEPDAALEPAFDLRWRLARNKMILAGHGAQVIPFILSPRVIEGARPAVDLTAPQPNLFDPTPQGCDPFGSQNLSCD